MSSPAPPRIFVVRDFSGAGLEQALQELVAAPASGYELRAPGIASDAGEILRDVVLEGIIDADRVLVVADRPNANVGFEAGLALGLGKPTLLVEFGGDGHSWIDRPPLLNTLVERRDDLDDLPDLVADEALWERVGLGPPERNPRGRAPGTLFVCSGGAAGRRCRTMQEDQQPFWQTLPDEPFTVRDLPRVLGDTFQVVWALVPPDDPGEFDGAENASHAVIVGWWCAQLLRGEPGRDTTHRIRERWAAVRSHVRVLRSTQVRPLRDVELFERTFADDRDFVGLVREIPGASLDAQPAMPEGWLFADTSDRPLPSLLREQVGRIQIRAVELTAGEEFDRALDELRAGDALSAALVAEWPDDPQLALARGYLLKTMAQVLQTSGVPELAGHAARRAVDSFRQAAALGADGMAAATLAQAVNGMGNLLQATGDLDGATEAYRRATELYPGYAAAWHDLYAVLVQRAPVDVAAARAAFDQLRARGQGSAGLSQRYLDSIERRLFVLERPIGQQDKLFAADAADVERTFLAELKRDGAGGAATEHGLARAAEEGDHRAFVAGLQALASGSEHRHDAERARRAALGIANAIGDRELCARLAVELAEHYAVGDSDSEAGHASWFASKAVELLGEDGDSVERARAYGAVALSHRRAGSAAAAERYARHALDILGADAPPGVVARHAGWLAEILLERGRSAEAAEMYRRARDEMLRGEGVAVAAQIDAWLRDQLPGLLDRDARLDDIRTELGRFAAHLEDCGAPPPGDLPELRVIDRLPYLGVYDVRSHEIRLSAAAVGQVAIALREYGYRALMDSLPEDLVRAMGHPAADPPRAVGEILAGAASYLVCSYLESPAIDVPGLGRFTDLERSDDLDDVTRAAPGMPAGELARAIQAAGTVWGGALWDLRSRVGKAADRLVLAAWTAAAEVPAEEFASTFNAALGANAPAEAGDVAALLAARGL